MNFYFHRLFMKPILRHLCSLTVCGTRKINQTNQNILLIFVFFYALEVLIDFFVKVTKFFQSKWAHESLVYNDSLLGHMFGGI